MPLKRFPQLSVFDPVALSGDCLTEGTVPWLLRTMGSRLMPAWLASEWRGSGTSGRDAWPADVLVRLLLLRWSDGETSRRKVCRRAQVALQWRAAMGLPMTGVSPTEKTVREFERWLATRSHESDLPRYLLLHMWIAQMVLSSVKEADRLWMMDGTPMFCFGALRGTVGMLGDGLRGLLRRYAKWTKQPFAKVATELAVPWVRAKSTKGGLCPDWRDREARQAAIHRLATDVTRVAQAMVERADDVPHKHRAFVHQRCSALLKILQDDFDVDDNGKLVIATRVAADRLVSITEPEARSGRKSKSQTFKGFKLHVLGDLVSGVVAAIRVTAGNVGEGTEGMTLLQRARELVPAVDRVLGDTAYGGTPLRIEAAELGVEIVAPPPPISLREGSNTLGKHEFDVDFAALEATCPAGVTTADHRVRTSKNGVKRSVFSWPVSVCAACPMRNRCRPGWEPPPPGPTPRGRPHCGKRLQLHPNERLLREVRARWNTEDYRREYRRRIEGERLVRGITRRGGRQAAAFGLVAANLQAHLIAMVCNLGVLARQSVESPPAPPVLPLFEEAH